MSKMHSNQFEINSLIVKTLIAKQFPKWAQISLSKFTSPGTDHAIYRLGEEMYARLPLTSKAQLQMEKELIWLPQLAPHLPLAIPTPIGSGEPDENFPFHWAVYSWIEGENATLDKISDETLAAQDLAGFILALQNINSDEGPLPGKHNFFRGVPLIARDQETRKAIEQLENLINTKQAVKIWEDSLKAPEWSKKPVWIHGDIHSGNLLAFEGKVTAVIDFGGLGIGDPACDLLVAWWLLTNHSREVFRSALQVDDATWRRGRGWALSMALIALPYYLHSNPSFAEVAKHVIDEVINDFKVHNTKD